MTLTQMQACFPHATSDWLQSILAAMDAFNISTTDQMAYFLGQVGHESQGLTRFEENLNYSAERLMAVWPARFPTAAKAQGYAHNPQALAYLVYGGRMGNVKPGDGWAYHGRGPLQLTGRTAYGACGADLGLDLLGEPELLLTTGPGASSAAWVWASNDLNHFADAGDIVTITKRVNGGLIGLAERTSWTDTIRQALGG